MLAASRAIVRAAARGAPPARPVRFRRLALQATARDAPGVRPALAGKAARRAHQPRPVAPAFDSHARISRWSLTNQVNQLLKETTDARGILTLIEEHADASLSSSNVCTAWHRLGRALINVPHNDRASLLAAHAPTLARMRALVERDAQTMRPAQLAATAYGLARTGKPFSTELLPVIARLAEAKAAECGPREVANLAWAMSAAGMADDPLLGRLMPLALEQLPTFRPDDLTLLISAYAQRGVPQRCRGGGGGGGGGGVRTLTEVKQDAARPQPDAGSAGAIAGHAQPDAPDEAELLLAAAERASALAFSLTPWQSSTILLAYATRGSNAWVQDEEAAAPPAERNLSAVTPAFELAEECALGSSRLALSVRALFRTVARAQLPLLHQFSPTDLSMLVSAFSVSRTAHRKLFDRACEVARPQLERFPPPALAMLVWGVARAGHFSVTTSPERVRLFEAAAHIASGCLERMSWQTALLLFRACASVPSVRTSGFTLALAEHAAPRLHELDDTSLSYLLWSFTELNERPQPLLGAATAELERRLPTLEPSTLAHLASAASILGLADAPLRERLVRAINAIPIERVRALSMPTLTQLHLFAWELEYAHAEGDGAGLGARGAEAAARSASEAAEAGSSSEGPTHTAVAPGAAPPALRPAPTLVRRDLRRAAESAMISGAKPSSSYYHMLFSEALEELGVPHENEHLVSELGLGYCVDIALPEMRVAIEINGPVHYDSARELLPRTVQKHKLLRRAGWCVISVPYFEWGFIAQTKERHAYVSGVIEALPALSRRATEAAPVS